jgi:hypothetical protein
MNRHRIGFLAVIAVVSGLSAPAGAAPTPEQKCAVAKLKAEVKKLDAKAKCHAKAIASGAVADSTCLTAAEDKFSSTIGKVENKGGCAVTGDAANIESTVDLCVDNLIGSATATFAGCTAYAGACGSCGDGICVNDNANLAANCTSAPCYCGSLGSCSGSCTTDADCLGGKKCLVPFGAGCCSPCN